MPHSTTVCVVTETYAPEINGAAMTLARLVDGLRGRGHLVSIVRPRRPGIDPHGSGREGPVTLVRGAPVPRYRGVRVGWPARRLLRQRWMTCRPDVVYVATPGPLGWAAVHAARRLGLPIFSGFHTDFPRYARHYGAGWLERGITGYLRRFHNSTRGTLVPSVDLLGSLAAAGFENLTLLGRGVDRRLFTPARRDAALRARWGAPDPALVALCVGRIAREKNVELAIAAYRAMRAAGRVHRLVIVGDGPLRGALQAGPSRRPLLRDPDGPCAGDALRVRRRLPVPERERNVRQRGPGSDGERARDRRVRLRGGACAPPSRRHRRPGSLRRSAPRSSPRPRALAGAPGLVARMRGARGRPRADCDWERVVDRFEALLTGVVRRPRCSSTGRRCGASTRRHA